MCDRQNNSGLALYYRKDKVDKTIRKYLQGYSEIPQWFWCEPFPMLNEKHIKLKPYSEFRKIHVVKNKSVFQNFIANLPLKIQEARLFWENGGVHLVAFDQGNYRVFEYRKVDAKPDGDDWKPEYVEISTYPVLLRQKSDQKRFGLEKPFINQVQIHEAWKDSTLFAWWLTVDRHESVQED